MRLPSDEIKKGLTRAPHRSLLRALGLSESDMELPFIGVANSFSEVIPGHIHLRSVAAAVKEGQQGGGGVSLNKGGAARGTRRTPACCSSRA